MTSSLKYFLLPVLAISLIAEVWHSHKKNLQTFKAKEVRSNLLIGAGAILSGLVARLFILAVFELAYQFRMFTLPNTWWTWILVFIFNDLCFYWYHRCQHFINWFWASHSIHHSAEEFNLLISIRVPWGTADLTGRFLFWLWMPFIGFDPVLMILVYEFLEAFQFLLHTEAVKKLPAPVEFIFNTPSHHRVHHGSDLKYLDKNMAGMLIIWDRIFGTFQAEEEHPTYGLTTPLNSPNPVKLVFHEWASLFKKLISSKSLKHAINYLVKPPGWSHDGSTKTVRELRDLSS
jgi:sterol desaturase/sphingolipid hydroxylase (fatty acid hydroxylase superfamily)